MKTKIIRLGNSKDIRLPKPVLEQRGLKGMVEIKIERNSLVLRPADVPRSGWNEAFAKMAARNDDALLDQETLPTSGWDHAKWRWRLDPAHVHQIRKGPTHVRSSRRIR